MSPAADLLREVRRGADHVRRRAPGTRPRLLPGYLIIGAQKAGTTSLHDWLCDHPAVGAPTRKEIHYFDHHATRPRAWYRAHFPREGGHQLTGEATPYYLFHPCAAERARRVIPQARLIAVLRDPVDRAISHHNHERALGHEALDLADALAAEPGRLAGQEALLRADPRARSFAHQHHSYVARGRYLPQLERWWRQFGREPLLVVIAEDLFRRPAETLADVQAFLGLAPHVPDDLQPRNARSHDGGGDAIRRELRARFAEDNARLAEALGRTLPW